MLVPHMAAVTKKRSGFGDILRRELETQAVSTRELARRLTAEEPQKLENVRRALIRYINGEHAPNDDTREAIAVALSVDFEVFAEDAVMQERRAKIADALQPLADVLLDIAVEVAREGRE